MFTTNSEYTIHAAILNLKQDFTGSLCDTFVQHKNHSAENSKYEVFEIYRYQHDMYAA